MKGTEIPHPSSDNFWSDPSRFYYSSSFTLPSRKKADTNLKEFLSSVDETPDFYDPYSDLNLFLSQKVRQEMQHCGCSKKWSLKVQEALLEKIGPEFQVKFPRYRLGVAALKKTWEKVAYYFQQIQHQKEAINEDGKLNVHFFIKENLKQYTCLKNSNHLHPCHFAHQLAVKMSECIATVDGIRPQLDQLTKMIWSVQRHLIHTPNPEQLQSPYDEYDKVDKLIVKTILEITAKDPLIPHQELEHQVKQSLHALQELPSLSSIDMLIGNISALLAEKLYASSPLHTQYFAEQKTAIVNFIVRHSSLCKTATPVFQLSELTRRIIALYTLASQLPKQLKKEIIQEAVQAMYPSFKENRPCLPQPVYAFIAAELVLMRNEEFCHSVDYVTDAIWSAYQQATCLPKLEGKESDILEVILWKTLSETEGLLEKLPYRIGQKIEEEIANIRIDNPLQSFSATVHTTMQFFRRTKELVEMKQWSEIERKIHRWVLQGDMLCRWIRLDTDSTLLKLIKSNRAYWSQQKEQPISHAIFVSQVLQEYLRQYPQISPYAGQLAQRIWILYKYAWYALFATNTESSYDRFIKWHVYHLLGNGFKKDLEALFLKIEEIVKKTTPLTPLDPEQTKALISSCI